MSAVPSPRRVRRVRRAGPDCGELIACMAAGNARRGSEAHTGGRASLVSCTGLRPRPAGAPPAPRRDAHANARRRDSYRLSPRANPNGTPAGATPTAWFGGCGADLRSSKY